MGAPRAAPQHRRSSPPQVLQIQSRGCVQTPVYPSIAQERVGYPRSAVFHHGVKKPKQTKKTIFQHRKRCPSHEKEPVTQRGPRHPRYSHTTVWVKYAPTATVPPGRTHASKEAQWGAECVCTKSRVSGHFQLSPGSAPSPSRSPPRCATSPVPPQREEPQPLPWLRPRLHETLTP